MRKNKILHMVIVALLLITLVFISGCVAPAGGETEGEGIGTWGMVIFLVLIFGMFYLLIIRPQRRKQKEHQELMIELRRGDKVVTAGGIYGVIESTSDDSVVIKVESGATIRVARGSVASKRPQ